ncbi:hypothetical protein NMY22_g16453 [Coprinellus aureogranulatus]|nr:hypothetical protein NMY22_g16453 [Coprinellus aureogranulatus]
MRDQLLAATVTMGRTKKYHTPEERAAAHRESNRKWHKRNRKKINRKRRKAYAKAHPKQEPIPCQSNSAPASDKPPPYWYARIQAIPRRLRRYTGMAPIDFAKSVCVQFADHHTDVVAAKDVIVKHTRQLDKILKSAREYQARILNDYGAEKEFQEGQTIEKSILDVITWVEEILVDAMVDPDLVGAKYRAGNFSFQKA